MTMPVICNQQHRICYKGEIQNTSCERYYGLSFFSGESPALDDSEPLQYVKDSQWSGCFVAIQRSTFEHRGKCTVSTDLHLG